MMISIWLQNSATTKPLLEGAQASVQLILPQYLKSRETVYDSVNPYNEYLYGNLIEESKN
jgi:hypothetical protein